MAAVQGTRRWARAGIVCPKCNVLVRWPKWKMHKARHHPNYDPSEAILPGEVGP